MEERRAGTLAADGAERSKFKEADQRTARFFLL